MLVTPNTLSLSFSQSSSFTSFWFSFHDFLWLAHCSHPFSLLQHHSPILTIFYPLDILSFLCIVEVARPKLVLMFWCPTSRRSRLVLSRYRTLRCNTHSVHKSAQNQHEIWLEHVTVHGNSVLSVEQQTETILPCFTSLLRVEDVFTCCIWLHCAQLWGKFYEPPRENRDLSSVICVLQNVAALEPNTPVRGGSVDPYQQQQYKKTADMCAAHCLSQFSSLQWVEMAMLYEILWAAIAADIVSWQLISILSLSVPGTDSNVPCVSVCPIFFQSSQYWSKSVWNAKWEQKCWECPTFGDAWWGWRGC